jgi:flagellar hook-basal body complex protein FliE
MHAVNDRIVSAEEGLTRLATGQTGNLHEVMLDLEKARLAFQLALQMRNKLLEGYQEIMRMQI